MPPHATCDQGRPTNRHPVDRLADIRAEIKQLEADEAELRKALLVEGADLSGSEFYGRVVTSTQNRMDRSALEQRFGAGAVAECCKPITVTKLVLVARDGLEAA